MSSFTLKLIACITMLIDHITLIFEIGKEQVLFHLALGSFEQDITVYDIGRGIGRISFPLFAFLIVQGYFHTRSLKKYLLRLGLFAIISEIPFDLAFWDFPNPDLLWFRQNILVTLFFGLLMISMLDWVKKRYEQQRLYLNFIQVLLLLAFSYLLLLVNGSYSEYGYGILLMAAFYYGYYDKKVSLILFIAITGFLCGGIQFVSILAAPFIYFYNGKKGYSIKYFFYLFYPLHLLLLHYLACAIE